MMAPSPAPKAPPRNAPSAPTGPAASMVERATRGIEVLVTAESRLRTKNGARYPTKQDPNSIPSVAPFFRLVVLRLRVYSNGTR